MSIAKVPIPEYKRDFLTCDLLLPPKVRALTGGLQGNHRLRVGKWRILFTVDKG